MSAVSFDDLVGYLIACVFLVGVIGVGRIVVELVDLTTSIGKDFSDDSWDHDEKK